MAEVKSSTTPIAPGRGIPPTSTSPADGTPRDGSGNAQQKRVPPHKLYALPAPIRTFPLPSFYPSNPLSLLHLVYAWLSHVLRPPPVEPYVVHQGFWSAETRSVHVTNPESIRALWEQGFFGKGSLSRSEPNWLRREQIRRGLVEGLVSEQVTNTRREERISAKWERARSEQEAIERTRAEEARLAAQMAGKGDGRGGPNASCLPAEPSAPVGPLELLALPNSHFESLSPANGQEPRDEAHESGPDPCADLTSGRNIDLNGPAHEGSPLNNGHATANGRAVNGNTAQVHGDPSSHHPEAMSQAILTEGDEETKSLRRQKSVRFSATVASTTFQHADPPSPHHSPPSSTKGTDQILADGVANGTSESKSPRAGNTPVEGDILDKEHLQLAPEEAFYLTFGLGALSVVDSTTKSPMPVEELFTLFRQSSYSPAGPPPPSSPDLRPDDPFLIHYAVYHHFRSLGWVPRPGIKFGVDWMLYFRGPVFDHAEFGLIVMPSYSDPRWKEAHQKAAAERSWHWLHGINRVLSHVLKSLVLVYVDIPSPQAFREAYEDPDGGIAGVFKLYKIREVLLRRWSSNRNR